MPEIESNSRQAARHSIELVGNQRLTVTRVSAESSPTRVPSDGSSSDVVQLVSAQGVTHLTIRVTERGAEIELGGASLALRVSGELALDAQRIHIHGREGLAMTSDGDVSIQTPGALSTTAHSQTITATRGDVGVRANDDVKIDGERIRMNC